MSATSHTPNPSSDLVRARELRNEILREELAEVKKAASRKRFRWKGQQDIGF